MNILDKFRNWLFDIETEEIPLEVLPEDSELQKTVREIYEETKDYIDDNTDVVMMIAGTPVIKCPINLISLYFDYKATGRSLSSQIIDHKWKHTLEINLVYEPYIEPVQGECDMLGGFWMPPALNGKKVF